LGFQNGATSATGTSATIAGLLDGTVARRYETCMSYSRGKKEFCY
jgi:hypothetical protein